MGFPSGHAELVGWTVAAACEGLACEWEEPMLEQAMSAMASRMAAARRIYPQRRQARRGNGRWITFACVPGLT
jgi:hypothetical protein